MMEPKTSLFGTSGSAALEFAHDGSRDRSLPDSALEQALLATPEARVGVAQAAEHASHLRIAAPARPAGGAARSGAKSERRPTVRTLGWLGRPRENMGRCSNDG